LNLGARLAPFSLSAASGRPGEPARRKCRRKYHDCLNPVAISGWQLCSTKQNTEGLTIFEKESLLVFAREFRHRGYFAREFHVGLS
jgi:hypothetical protein